MKNKNNINARKDARPCVSNIPILRFPEFEGEWILHKVGELCDFIVPGRNKPKKFDGNIPWITTPDIKHFGTIEKSRIGLAISEEEARNVGSKIVPQDAIIMSCVGELGIVSKTKNKIIINQQLHAFIPRKDVDNWFLLYDLSTRKRYMEKVATKTAVPYMNKDNCNSIPIILPTLPEQQKIASFLTATDKKIQALKKKKSLLEQYKKGIMQKLFHVKADVRPSLRFKPAVSQVEGGDTGKEFPDWVNKELGELLDYEQPTKYTVKSTEYDDKYDIPVITAGKTFILGYSDEKDGVFNKNLPIIAFDDFTTATQFVDFEFKVKSSAMKILIAKRDVNIKFVYEAMQNINFVIGGHGRHWISVFAQLPIKYPCLAEQTKIANFLSATDKKIEKTENKITQTEQWKKGLLQQMFV